MKFFLSLVTQITFLVLCASCTSTEDHKIQDDPASSTKQPVKTYIPDDGKCLVFIGQELDAIGGVGQWSDGYLDHFDRPYGFTMYTDLMPGTESFGFTHRGLDGLRTTDNWGDGPSNMSIQLGDPDYAGMALAIGLDLKGGHEDRVAAGEHDSLISSLGQFLTQHSTREIYLRIGYEFDGHGWNNYDAENYIKAYRRIKDKLDDMGLKNIQYVWQSKGRGVKVEELDAYYPGDDYVDWTGFSFFAADNENHPMIEYSRKLGKPLFIAEATPILVAADSDDGAALDFRQEADCQKAWDEWFIPFFRCIESNQDVIKAISYINCNWRSHVMWEEIPYFDELDVRLQLHPWIKAKWEEKMSEERYVLADN